MLRSNFDYEQKFDRCIEFAKMMEFDIISFENN